MDGDLGRDTQKILAILPRIVGHAANHPLPVQQVVIHRRDSAHVDSGEHQRAALLEHLQRRRHQLTCGREDDGAVQRGRFLAIRIFRARISSPLSAQIEREPLMCRVTRERVHFNTPVPRHLYRHVRRGAEPVEA